MNEEWHFEFSGYSTRLQRPIVRDWWRYRPAGPGPAIPKPPPQLCPAWLPPDRYPCRAQRHDRQTCRGFMLVVVEHPTEGKFYKCDTCKREAFE